MKPWGQAMAQEELLFQLSMLEQQSQQLSQQLENVNSQIGEMEALKLSLEKLEKGKDKEMLANLGRGIFLRTKQDDDKVFVNVGSRTLVKKSFSEAVEIIDKQVPELKEIRHILQEQALQVSKEVDKIVREANKKD